MLPVLADVLAPIQLPELVGVTLSLTLLIIPVLGATIRYAAKPLVDALSNAGLIGKRVTTDSSTNVELLSHRVLELEQEVAQLKARTAVDLAPTDVNGAHAFAQLRR